MVKWLENNNVCPASGAANNLLLKSNRSKDSQKQDSNHQKTIGNVNISEETLNIHNDLLFSDNKRETIKPTIANGRLAVNSLPYSESFETPKTPGATSKTPNQPEVKLINIEANTS